MSYIKKIKIENNIYQIQDEEALHDVSISTEEPTQGPVLWFDPATSSAIEGNEGLLTYIDKSGNKFIMYPATKAGLVDGLNELLDEKAPLESPNLNGTPTAPTAQAGTNNTQIATTEFVQTTINEATGGITPESIGAQDKINGTQGQVVGFDENGNAIAQDAESDIFWATYDETTYNDIVAAYQSGKIVQFIRSNRIYRLYKIDGDYAYFQAYASDESMYNGLCSSSNVWERQYPKYIPKEHASSHASDGTDPVNEIQEQNKGLAQRFWRGTQAEYDALATKDENTMYIVTDAAGMCSGDMLKSVYDTEGKNTDIFKYVDTHAAPVSHVSDTVAHVTQSEKDTWNAKLDSFTETDPTVPDWAKQATKPTYTASEVGALPSSTVIPTKVSQLTNDSGYITGYTETDPTVPAWAKAASKPSYSAAEVGAIPTSASCNKNWNWSGQGGQPTWLWGGEDGTNMYVYNPANFTVNYANGANHANSAGNADTVDGWHMNLDPHGWGIKPHCAGTGGMASGSTGLSNGHIYMQYE